LIQKVYTFPKHISGYTLVRRIGAVQWQYMSGIAGFFSRVVFDIRF